MSKAPATVKYQINQERLFDDTLSDGSHKHTLRDGTIIEAHVESGRIAGYTAYDKAGNKLPVSRMRLSEAEKSGAAGAPECMYCICDGDTCRCWVEPCLQ